MKTNGVVNFLLFSPDGKLLATKTGWDHNIRFWDTETGKLYKELHHNRLMLDIEFSSDGTLLAAGSEDRTALIWDITTGELMEKTTPHRGYVSVITFSRDGKLLVTYSADGKTVRLWDVAAGEPYGTQLHCPNAQGILSFSSDNEFLISPGNCIWKSHQPLHTEIIPYQPWASLGHSNPDGTISVMYKENTIRLWDMATKQAIGEPLECGYEITNIAFSPDGKRLACSYGGFHRFSPDLNVGQYGIGYIRLWEVSTGRPVGPILETGFAFSLTFSPDGKLLAVGTRDSTADVFDMTTWQRVQTLSCSGHVYAIAFSPDSKILAAGTNNGTVELWDMTTGEQIGVPLTLPSTVNSVTFSPDGNLLATVSGDEEQTVQIWDISSVTPYQGLVLPFSAMQGKEALQSFSKNGTIIVSRYGEDTAQAWRLPEEPTDLQEMQLKTWIALGARRNSQGEATSIPSSNWSLYKQELALRTQAHELQLVDVIDSSEANKVKLVWTPGPDTAAYQVYLGTDPKQLKLLDEVKEASYENVPALDRNKTYWWRIDSAKSDGSVMKGNLWTSRAGKLVGWWKFDEMESHRAADSSGNGLDGEFVDDARIVKDAERGNVLSLDGDGDYVDFGDDLKFDITNEITIAAWVNFRDIPSYWWMTIISKGDSAWRLSISENTRKYHFAVCNGSYGNYLDGKIELATDEWHHVCGTYDGEMIRLYVDGVLDTMLANNEAILTNNFNVCIGENQEAPGRYWDGLIDDVQVYSYAMSPMEIEAIYTGQELKLSNKPKWFFEVNSEESVQSDTQLDETTTYYVPLASEQKPEEEKSPTWSAVPSHDIEQVKSFISESTDPETKNIALQEACYAGNLDIVKFLIDIGADVNAWIGTRGTALLSATLANHKQIAELLIANGADVNRRNYIGQSILHFACQEGNKEIVQLLIDNKAYIEALNNYGQTPLNLAQQVGHTEIIELLREHGAAEVQSLHGAAATGNIERVKQLISEGADLEEKVNTSFGPNTTPLHMAAANGRTEVAKLLIDHGADVNAQEDEGWRETPLHHAASSGHRDVVELLINKGAEIDCKLSDGFTPLALAVEQGNRDIAELLIENGANVNVKNNEGGTPLHSSCQSGNKEVTELLIDHGADVNIKDRIDQTPLHLAQRGGHTEIVELLKQAESTEPYPDNRVKDIPINTILSWRSGKYADTHNVYIGTDFQDVNEASLDTTLGVTISEGQDVNSYHPGILDFNQTYYWRVDEVNKPPESSIYKGDVWSFTTGNCIIIDDFEGYKDSGSYTIRNTWHDGYENDENGSRIGHEVHPFLETRMVYAGGQSAPFKYDNTISPYSEISVDPANLAIGRDWSVGSPQTMVIWIHGDLGNIANDGLYARINNTKVEFEGNLSVPIWKKWNIDLTDLNLNLSNITNLSIGVEGSGTGMLFLDDILLYRNTPPIVQPVDPGTGNLVAQYAMENNVQDSSGNNLNGTTYGNPTYKQGLPGYGMALKLDGNDDYVDLPIGSAISTMNSCTITSWVKWSGNGGNWQRIFDFGTDTDINMYMTPRNGTLRLLQFAITTAGGNQESRFVALDSLSTNWQHIALVINGTSKTMRLYLDAQFFASSSTQLTPADLGQTTNNWLGRSQYTADPYFDGLLDDFRIYDTALSEGQIRYIAGDR